MGTGGCTPFFEHRLPLRFLPESALSGLVDLLGGPSHDSSVVPAPGGVNRSAPTRVRHQTVDTGSPQACAGVLLFSLTTWKLHVIIK